MLAHPILRSAAAALLLAILALPGPAGAQTAAPATDHPAASAESAADAPAEGDADAPSEEMAGPPAPETPPPVYEDQLLRLAEILGSLHFLRGLCDEADAASWKAEMEALLAAEAPGPQRRSRLTGRFNHGYETFNAAYRACTPSARRSIWRYLNEGRALSGDVQARYSQ